MILHYHLLFCKEIYFFECLYFSEYDIRMPLYVFLVEKGASIKYVSNWREIRGERGGRGGRVTQNASSCVQGDGLTRLMCTYEYLNISNSYCGKPKHHCIFNQRNLWNSLIHSSLFSIFEFS